MREFALAAARSCACAALLAIAGCATVSGPPGTEPDVAADTFRYDVVAGRDADLVARLRAAPAPVPPQVDDGGTRAGDERVLREQGLVEIGVASFAAADAADAHAQALRQGMRVGADRIELYPPPAATEDTVDPGTWMATYFVRLQLPFGADFRDMSEQERAQADRAGIIIGEVIGDTPAAAANLRSGDVVVEFQKRPVADKAQFQSLLQDHLGKDVTLTVRRGKIVFKRLVRLGTLPAVPAS